MENQSIFLVESNPVWGNLLKYRLGSARYTNVRLFPTCSEVLRHLERHEVPHFIILETEGIGLSPLAFMRQVHSLQPSIRMIFFTRNADHQMAGELMEAGAADYIVRSGRQEEGISELIKNLGYLCREAYQYR